MLLVPKVLKKRITWESTVMLAMGVALLGRFVGLLGVFFRDLRGRLQVLSRPMLLLLLVLLLLSWLVRLLSLVLPSALA